MATGAVQRWYWLSEEYKGHWFEIDITEVYFTAMRVKQRLQYI